MGKKKNLFDITIIIVGLIIFFIWYHREFQTVATTALDTYNIYLITMDKKEEFAYDLNRGAEDMAELLGVNYIWDAPEVRGLDEQIKVINRAVAAGADAILLVAAIDPVGISGAVKDAKDKGVKIVYVDAPAEEEAVTTLATDNYTAGRIAGELMISELEALGIQSGSIGMIGVTPQTLTTINRERGFSDVIVGDKRYKLLDTLYAKADPVISQSAAEQLIRENTDLVGLFGTNEGSTIGVGNAIKASGKNIVGIGFDFTETIQQLLDSEDLKAVLVQNPYTMGYLGMAEAFAAVKGYETGPSYINTGVSVIPWYDPRLPIRR